MIVAEMLGVPEERHEDFRRWSQRGHRQHRVRPRAARVRRLMDEAIAELNDYLDEEIERHRRESLDDVLDVMVNMSGLERGRDPLLGDQPAARRL